MKNALILHGTSADHTQNWFSWLGQELDSLGYKTWVPDLPGADHPNYKTYNAFLLDPANNWDFNNESIIIGHSSGAVEILALLSDPKFPGNVKVKACFLVGVFKGDLGWESLKGMNAEFDYKLIKQKSSSFVFLHECNDPYCPINDAKDICKELGGNFVEIDGKAHFSVSLDPKYNKNPLLLNLIKRSV